MPDERIGQPKGSAVKPWPTSQAPKLVNVAKLLGEIPDLGTLDLTCDTPPLKGKPIRVAWDGAWEVDAPQFPSRLGALPNSIEAVSSSGRLILSDVMLTRFGGGEPIGGISNGVTLRRQPVSLPALFRSYIACGESLGRIGFPESLREVAANGSTKKEWKGLLPLELDGTIIECFFVDGPQPFFVCEAVRDSIEDFKRHVEAVRMMLTFLTAEPLEDKSCDLILSMDGHLLEARWTGGWGPRKSSIYSPIPVTWGAFARYRYSRRLPLEGKVLAASMIAACVQKLLNEPDLETPLSYIRLAVDAPIEIRGAMLSIALESLTGHLKEKGFIKDTIPVAEAEWTQLLPALQQAVTQTIATMEIEPQKRADLLERLDSKIRNMNQPTNSDKLTAPFRELNVPLNEEEARAIRDRNKLLHTGRILRPLDLRSHSERWKYPYNIDMRILTALNKLLLRFLGYHGPVYDWGEAGVDGLADHHFTALEADDRFSREPHELNHGRE